VGDDVRALERVLAQKIGHGRVRGAFAIDKQAQPLALEKGDAPTVAVVVGGATAALQAAEAELGVGRGGAVESEQLAHRRVA